MNDLGWKLIHFYTLSWGMSLLLYRAEVLDCPRTPGTVMFKLAYNWKPRGIISKWQIPLFLTLCVSKVGNKNIPPRPFRWSSRLGTHYRRDKALGEHRPQGCVKFTESSVRILKIFYPGSKTGKCALQQQQQKAVDFNYLGAVINNYSQPLRERVCSSLNSLVTTGLPGECV